MDDLRAMARRSLQLFEQFIGEARSVLGEQGISAAQAKERIKASQQLLVQETEELLNTFRLRVAEKERELQAILQPLQEDLDEEARKALRQLNRLIERLFLKDKLTRRWMDQSASAMLSDYQEALRDGDRDKVETFEAQAEPFLARKEDPQALSEFIRLRTESQDSRLTPVQRQAKSALQELHRIKQEATVGLSFLASTSGIYGGFFPITGLWREEERRRLDRVDQAGISVVLHKEGDPPVPVALMDMSKGGLRVQSYEEFPNGANVTVSLDCTGVTDEAIYFKAEVRWCREEPGEPGRFALGLRVVEETQEPWLELLPKLIDNLNEFKRLFSSLNE